MYQGSTLITRTRINTIIENDDIIIELAPIKKPPEPFIFIFCLDITSLPAAQSIKNQINITNNKLVEAKTDFKTKPIRESCITVLRAAISNGFST
ncbi:MAG: hypothetical protein Kow0029_05250 [Candidatus Rifleibacteriota bacterium]